MLKMYLKIIVRNFVKDRFFSMINVSGLAVGIAVVLVTALYVINEWTFDRFHTKADRMHRVLIHLEMAGNSDDYNSTFPVLAQTLENEIPDVELAVRVTSQDGQVFKMNDKVFSEDDIFFVDPEFFKVFDFKLLKGDPTHVLDKPHQIVLTPKLVEKYLGATGLDIAVGKSILIDDEVFEISGVVEEAPLNSHFHFQAIASIASIPQGRDETWANMSVATYILLKENGDIGATNSKFEQVFLKHIANYANYRKEGVILEAKTQPLLDIHLHSDAQGEFEPNGSISNVYIFATVGIIVLVLACVNFINLVTARSANRAKEVGVRKVLGSAYGQLFRQFTLESVLLVLMATLVALALVELLRSSLNELFGKPLPFELLLSLPSIGTLVIFVILLGIVAGSYPAFFLASFKPAQVLKGKIRSGFKSSGFRNVLVTVQFAISILLITCTLIVQDQLTFMRSKKLGFDKDNVVVIENANEISNPDVFKNRLRQIEGVDMIGSAESKPIDEYGGIPVTTELDRDNRKLLNASRIDYDYMPTLKYEIVEGRNFSADYASDTTGVILNERAAKYLFGTESALGKKIFYDRKEGYTVLGIVRDFNFESLKNEVRPLAFFAGFNQYNLHVRLKPGDHHATIRAIGSLWLSQNPGVPFAYSFLDDSYTKLFAEESRLGTLFSVLTGLALFIACLGLLGLASYLAEQRKKEISVRKILGATLGQVFMLMSRDFLKVIMVAYFISVPVAYFAMRGWLSDFAYRVNVSPLLLVIGGIFVMAVALLTVSFQALRAGVINPVDALKDE